MSHAAVLCGGPQPGSVHAHQLPRRVIIHVDLDCFYCKSAPTAVSVRISSSAVGNWLRQATSLTAGQVEQKRLNIPTEVPCAVQQWDGLIAVNYAARAAGEHDVM